VWRVTKTLCSLPYKTRQATEDGDCKRTHFCNRFLWSVHDGLLDPKVTFLADKAGLHLSGCISAQNNEYWSNINLRLVLSTPSWSEDWCMVCHYCYMNSRIHIFFFCQAIQSRVSVKFFGPFWQYYGKWKYIILCKMVLEYTLLILWPATSPNLNPCDFFISGET
jgi:hypothetical protein